MGERWLDRSEWDNAICSDLRPVLTFLEEQYGLSIAKIHLDIKAIITEVYLDGEAPPKAVEILQSQFSGNAHLRFWEKGCVSCHKDWISISWNFSQGAVPSPSTRPWWKLW